MTQTRPLKTNLFNRNADLLHGPIFKNLFLFMLPILVSNLFQQLYNTVDTMIVGNVLGDTALAAIGSCGSIYELLVGFGIGIGNGLSIVAARSYGAQDEDLLKRTVAGSLVIGLCASFVITAAGFFGLRPLLQLLDTPAEILEDAYRYIIVIDLGVLVMFLYNLCAGLLRAIGNSVMPLVFLLISSGLNVALDLWFIAGLGMGVQGAAVATVIAQGISVVLCILYVMRRVPLLLPARRHWAVGQHLYWELFSQSISMGLMSSIVSAGSVVLQYGINGLGTLTIAGHTAARKLFSFTSMPLISMANAGSTFVSQNRGAGQPERVRKGMRTMYLCSVVIMAADIVLMQLFARQLVQLISGSSAPRAGKRRTVSDVERAVLRGAGCAAVHPVRFAEPWTEGAAAVFQRHRAGRQGGFCAGVHPALRLQRRHPVRAHHLVLHGGISRGSVPPRCLCVSEKRAIKRALSDSELALSGAYAPALPKGEPLAWRQSLRFRQSLSLWERWICEAKTERARTLSKKAHPRTARRAVRGCCVMIYDVFTMRKVFPRLMQSSSRSYSAGTSPMTFTFSSAGRSARMS